MNINNARVLIKKKIIFDYLLISLIDNNISGCIVKLNLLVFITKILEKFNYPSILLVKSSSLDSYYIYQDLNSKGDGEFISDLTLNKEESKIE